MIVVPRFVSLAEKYFNQEANYDSVDAAPHVAQRKSNLSLGLLCSAL